MTTLIVSPDADLDVARSDNHYENWEITGPGELNLVSPPAGGDARIRD